MRASQTRTCKNCGHSSSRDVKYPKYGSSETPLWVIARRSLCLQCGARGKCILEENGLRFDANGPLPGTGGNPFQKLPPGPDQAATLNSTEGASTSLPRR